MMDLECTLEVVYVIGDSEYATLSCTLEVA